MWQPDSLDQLYGEKIMFIRSFAVAGSLALAACANAGSEGMDAQQPTLSSSRECFYLSQVSGFTDAPDAENGSGRILVHTGPRDIYLFETFGSCPDLNYSESIAFDQNGPGQICRGIDVDLLVPTSIGIQRCPVRMISKVPDAR
ncbi:hypothetical protein EKN06_14455 [Croceicoccus ponticola]|uniref:Uncharacterized protein n=1 Tax=Croceicoccus ponticola TaxID=2217664 RepID=A0A437GUB6_9SPHN|nr:DUF6491 family protein [Croceicoccus ponticola]RVQ65000.1 hypothetical protein EKN06_14455 [Croceicoccus ponticola]